MFDLDSTFQYYLDDQKTQPDHAKYFMRTLKEKYYDLLFDILDKIQKKDKNIKYPYLACLNYILRKDYKRLIRGNPPDYCYFEVLEDLVAYRKPRDNLFEHITNNIKNLTVGLRKKRYKARKLFQYGNAKKPVLFSPI